MENLNKTYCINMSHRKLNANLVVRTALKTIDTFLFFGMFHICKQRKLTVVSTSI